MSDCPELRQQCRLVVMAFDESVEVAGKFLIGAITEPALGVSESGRGVLIETHLIDRDEDLYGRTLRVAFVERLRGEKRFPDAERLIAQMRRDVDDATWQPYEVDTLASFWGHDGLVRAVGGEDPPLEIRHDAQNQQRRAPVQVIDGNYARIKGVCPWWDAVKAQSGE